MRFAVLLALFAAPIFAQNGQQGARPGWPCVAGRPVDTAYIETSESTGGQLFLFQRSEAIHSGLVMNSIHTHPATILRAIGNLSGTREFEFLVDSTIHSILVMASLQCRNAVQLIRPGGSEITQGVDLRAGRIVQLDSPEAGKWRVRLAGNGLYVLSVVAQTDLKLTGVRYDGQTVTAYLSRDVANARFQLIGAAGELISELNTPEPDTGGAYHFDIAPRSERFRLKVIGADPMAWPLERTYPVLFRANASSRTPRN